MPNREGSEIPVIPVQILSRYDPSHDTKRLWSKARDFLDGSINISPDDYLDELESAE